MNICTLMGRLVRDPDVKYTQNGKVVAHITLAIDRFSKDNNEKETDFVKCTLFGKQAEACGNYCSKGQRLLVSGSLRVTSYEDKAGVKRIDTSVLVSTMEYIEKREENAGVNGKADFGFMGKEVSIGEISF